MVKFFSDDSPSSHDCWEANLEIGLHAPNWPEIIVSLFLAFSRFPRAAWLFRGGSPYWILDWNLRLCDRSGRCLHKNLGPLPPDRNDGSALAAGTSAVGPDRIVDGC